MFYSLFYAFFYSIVPGKGFMQTSNTHEAFIIVSLLYESVFKFSAVKENMLQQRT